MEKQNMSISIPRDLLKPEDLRIDGNGNLSLDKAKLNKLIKENINKAPGNEVATVTVGVSVGVG